MDLKELDKHFQDVSYILGHRVSHFDFAFVHLVKDALENTLKGTNFSEYKHFNRYYNHILNHPDFPKDAKVAASAGAGSKSKPKKEEKQPKKGGDDDDDIDLFGSGDDEEAEKAKAERAKQMEAQKKGAKPGVVAKSSIALDVKVWDDTTDLKEVEKSVRSIEKEGLLWGSSQLVPVAFGMNKLRIVCVVEDEKVSVDWLTDKIEELELVQSTDIAAFQKI
jgi:elongation factor 1-beta